jgi:hypothetical protein
MSHTIQHSDGSEHGTYSGTCPKCFSLTVSKPEPGVKRTADFDETGNWFYPVKFTCLDPKCKHEWVEKFMIRQ